MLAISAWSSGSTSGMAYSVVRPVPLMMTRGQRGPTAETRRRLEEAREEARRTAEDSLINFLLATQETREGA